MKIVYCIIFIFGFSGFSQTQKYSVTNLNINSEYPHFGLMRIGQNQVIFTSYLLGKKGRVEKFQGTPILTIFLGEISKGGQITNVVPIQIDTEQDIKNITSGTISPDRTKLYITTRYTYKNKPNENFNIENFHIEVGEFNEEVGWTNFKVLAFCKPKYSYAHPTFSKDGKTLYFTANIRGGKENTRGGSDIFKVDILENNTFSEPKNLGSKVNSYSREMFPFIDDDTLYFASNRPGGFGGYDIYKSVMDENGEFGKAIKLPKPLNSIKDDFSLITLDDKDSGYLVSKRLKGKGDDDIYYFIKN